MPATTASPLPATMKAIVQTEWSGPGAAALRLEDVPLPSVGPRDVLVRVKAAASNPIDVKKSTGAWDGGKPFAEAQPGGKPLVRTHHHLLTKLHITWHAQTP